MGSLFRAGAWRSRLKIRRPQGLTSSSLVSGTIAVVEEFGDFTDGVLSPSEQRGRYPSAWQKRINGARSGPEW
jgi:hypothetical protein